MATATTSHELAPETIKACKRALKGWCHATGRPVPKFFNWKLPVVGLWTRDTIRAYQKAKRLKQTGLFDAPTRAKLIPPPPIDPNIFGVAWLERNRGPKEQSGKNDGPWLRVQYGDGGDHDQWFASTGQPYCARIGVVEAFQEAGVDLVDLFPGFNWNWCPDIERAILTRAKSRDGKWQWEPVALAHTLRGDVTLHNGWDPVLRRYTATHVSRVSSSPSGAFVRTTGANTPKGLDGDQAGLGAGDGIWTKTYPLSTFRCAGRLRRIG